LSLKERIPDDMVEAVTDRYWEEMEKRGKGFEACLQRYHDAPALGTN
jgi:hypothetical protein